MQLTTEQIDFIDSYLIKSKVIYVDVRAELTDHIALGIEEKMQQEKLDFYNAFKDYMVLNKKELLKRSERNFYYFIQTVSSYAKSLLDPYNLMFGLTLVVALFYTDIFIYAQEINNGMYISICLMAVFHLLYIFVTKKKYLCIENLGSVSITIYFYNLYANGFYGDFYGNTFTVGLGLFLLFAYFSYALKTFFRFKVNYL